ncbi:MAG: PIG-L family deacetylase [Deltaproteobacteria bacterium]|nr:PIG-L family deacetylase [Deltaproteobacteria bacterium]
MIPLDKIQSASKPFPLAELLIPTESRILILAPHPDDFDEVAVTLRYFFNRKHPMQLLVLTGASSGVLDSFVDLPTKERKEEVRQIEQLNALEFFGFPASNVQFLRLLEDPTGELVLDETNPSAVGTIFQDFNPDVVSLPYGKDTNLSHQRTFQLFQELALTLPKPVLGLCHRDPKTTDIKIQAYFPFDEETARWKAEMLRFHRSQHTRNLQTRNYGIDDRILNTNRAIARELGIKEPYAEGFELVVVNGSRHSAAK